MRCRFGKIEKNLDSLVSAAVADGGNPFPPHPQDETLTGLVATHDAMPGARPGDGAEFKAVEGGGESVRGHTTVQDRRPLPRQSPAAMRPPLDASDSTQCEASALSAELGR